LRTALERLRPGEVSGVLRLPTGFGVLKRVADVDVGPGEGAPGSSTTTVMASAALGSTGSVKYVNDVSGYVETVLALRQAALPIDATDDFGTLCQVRGKLVSSAQSLVAEALRSPDGA